MNKAKVYQIAEKAKALGYKVPAIEFVELPKNTDGQIITKAFTGEETIQISINCQQDEEYVIAHEIGHANDDREFDFWAYISQEDETRKSEMFADKFAAMILKK